MALTYNARAAETTRECPACHEEHVPVASAKGPVCPSCGHRYNG